MTIDSTELQQRIAYFEEIERRYELLVSSKTLGIFESDVSGTTYFMNDTLVAMLGLTQDEWAALSAEQRISWTELTPPEHLVKDKQAEQEAVRSGRCKPFQKEYYLIPDMHKPPEERRRVPVQLEAIILDATPPMRIVGYVVDLTEIKAMEQQAVRLREEIIQARDEVIRTQQQTLAELSTPVIPLRRDVLLMPLIGAIDTHRARRVLDGLLDGVSRSHARTVILDISGVPIIDSQVANALSRAAEAVKLLGAEVVLSGMRAEVAQTVVQLGLRLPFTTVATLDAAISLVFDDAER